MLRRLITHLFTVSPTLDPNDPTSVRLNKHHRQFLAWLEKVLEGRENFEQVDARFARLADRLGARADAFAFHLLRSAWSAAQWQAESLKWPDDRPDMYAEETWSLTWLQGSTESSAMQLEALAASITNGGELTRRYGEIISSAELRDLAARLRKARDAIKTMAPASVAQVGPLFYSDGVGSRTRIPNPATLLAIDVFYNFKGHELKPMDWVLTSYLAALAGLDHDPQGLRVSAMKIINNDVRTGKARFVGWPVDVGPALEDVKRMLGPA